ncbi:MAG: hypothetical protein AAB922_04835 [Patescibacteria group bacterium]
MALNVFQKCLFQANVFQTDVCGESTALNVFQKCLFQPGVFQTDICGEVIPPGGGGGYARQIVYKPAIDDAEEIFMMMVNSFMRMQ